MALADIWQQPLLAAGLAALLGAVRLWQRFSERRPFSTAQTTVLFIAICVVSAAVADLLAAGVGLLGAGAAYAFTTPPPNNGGELSGNDGPDQGSLLTQLASGVIALTGGLTNILDRRLSAVKLAACKRILAEVERAYPEEDYEFYERLGELFKDWIRNLTDPRQQDVRYARLRAAYDRANRARGTERYLLELVYDWKLEKLLAAVLADPPGRRRTAPPDQPPAAAC